MEYLAILLARFLEPPTVFELSEHGFDVPPSAVMEDDLLEVKVRVGGQKESWLRNYTFVIDEPDSTVPLA